MLTSPNKPRLNWREAIYFVLLLYAVIWSSPLIKMKPVSWTIVGLALIGWPVISMLIHRESWKDLGFRLDNLREASVRGLVATSIITLFILLVGIQLGWDTRWRPGRLLIILFYFPWGLAQQFVTQSFLYRRLRTSTLAPNHVAIITAVLFGLTHMPNYALVIVTTFAGYIWCRIFERTPNLFPLALSHAWLAVLFMAQVPNSIHHHMRIGPHFWK